MKRITLHRVVDTFAFVGFVLLTATGIVLRYLLPPGSGRFQGRGTGLRAAEKPVTLLWGLTRHVWGEVHVWLALGLMLVLALHVVLHWRWIVCTIRGRPREGSGARLSLGMVGLAALLALTVALFLSPTARVPRSQLSGPSAPSRSEPPQEYQVPRARGAMTLRDIADITGVPIAIFVERLGLPRDLSPDESLERLRRLHGLTTDDLRRVVAAYRE